MRAVQAVQREGVPLDDVLDALLADFSGSARDRALAFEIAVGTTRYFNLLDHLLVRCMERPLPVGRHWTRAALRTGLYQAAFLRIPARAAVHETVELVKNSPERALAGFVNAVLRRAAGLDREQVVAEISDPEARLAVATAHPPWLVTRWVARLGLEGARRRLEAGNRPPPLTLRVNTLATSRERVIAALQQAGCEVQPMAGVPQGLVLPRPAGGVAALPGFAEGWFVVQDPAAQRVAPFLDPRPGERILDLCAAPGGKTTHLAALAEGKARVVAVEKRLTRIPRLRENLTRLKVPGVTVQRGDGAEVAGEAAFDKVLVDAPCTGTGIIRRHPDVKWRRGPGDLARMVVEQERLLTAAARAVRPGGVLVYATCSLEPEENEARIEAFLADHPDWQRRSLVPELEAPLLTPAGDFASEPGWADMDGFYAARLQRK